MGADNLPEYSIYMHPNQLKDMTRNTWSDHSQPGKLRKGTRWVPIEVSYRGNYTRKSPKKSYQVSLLKTKQQHEEVIHLNAEYNDPSLIRNKLSMDFFADLGVLSPNAEHILLTINGQFRGLYLQLESVDEQFFNRRGTRVRAIYYAINDDANFSFISPLNDDVKNSLDSGYEKTYGDTAEDSHLRELIYKINTIPRHEFEREIIKYLDINKYLLWLTGVVCTQNFDGFTQNYTLYRDADSGLYAMSPWDYDATWGRDIDGKGMQNECVPIEGFNTLSARILDIYSFRQMYGAIIETALESKFTVAYLESKVNDLLQRLHPHIKSDPFISDKYSQFMTEHEFILEFIKKRNRYLKEQLVTFRKNN